MDRPAPLTDHDLRCFGVLMLFDGPVVRAAQFVCPHGLLPTYGTLYGSPSTTAIERHKVEYERVQARAALRPEPPI